MSIALREGLTGFVHKTDSGWSGMKLEVGRVDKIIKDISGRKIEEKIRSMKI